MKITIVNIKRSKDDFPLTSGLDYSKMVNITKSKNRGGDHFRLKSLK